MANLPPRPESPLRMPPREDRRVADERERDRRSALPMAPRYRSEHPERLTERERDRSYFPRSRVDSYVGSRFDSRRERDHRDYDDRERDRSRRDYDRDRDRRDYDRGRDRDRDRSPPRRWSPDRRPYDRAPPRRPLSPLRRSGPPRRDSRSPPPRRRFSRSPSYRGRNRTRSRSPRPYRSPPPRGIRLGNHSIAASPRSRSSRSPHRRRYSRDRSPGSPTRRSNHRPSSPRRDDQKLLPTEPSADRRKEEPAHTTLDAQSSPVKTEEPTSALPANLTLDQSEQTQSSKMAAELTHPSSQFSVKTEETKSENKPDSVSIVPPEPTKSKTEVPQQSIAPPEAPDVKMDSVDSPKPPTLTSTQSRGSTPPKASPIANDQNRGPPTGPRWGQRSPPRGPRSHLHPRPPPVLQSSSSYQSTPRGPRREYRGPPPSYQSVTPKSGPPLPVIPPYWKPPPLQPQPQADLEAEIAKLQTQRAHLGVEHLQHINSSRRALQELDVATIDLHAAENRRRVTDMQLEKAKTGSLGIDAPLTDFGGI